MYYLFVLSIVVINVVYWCIEGFREAYYYDRLPNEDIYAINRLIFKKQPKIKIQFVFQRACFLTINWLVICLLKLPILFFAGILLIQPYFHLGMYYRHRNKLNKELYTKGFYSNASTTSSAFLDVKSKMGFSKFLNIKSYLILTETPIIRIVLAIFGAFLIFISI